MSKGFRYEQSTGILSLRNGDYRTPLASCYAGNTTGLNNPDAQCEKNVGPLPRAFYRMRVVDHPRFAAPAIKLIPLEGDLCGRSGFYIHGDNSRADYSASQGCIIANRGVREFIRQAILVGFDELMVVI